MAVSLRQRTEQMHVMDDTQLDSTAASLSPAVILALATELGVLLSARGQTISTAESCTGGLISGAITEVEGSSAWFEQGFVTYSNHAKSAALGVDPVLVERWGAVSLPVVAAMAAGACRVSGADIGVAVSGVAGPGGGSVEKPVGTVCIGWALPGQEPVCRALLLPGDRRYVRLATVYEALRGTIRLLEKHGGATA